MKNCIYNIFSGKIFERNWNVFSSPPRDFSGHTGSPIYLFLPTDREYQKFLSYLSNTRYDNPAKKQQTMVDKIPVCEAHIQKKSCIENKPHNNNSTTLYFS
jgi:hypothetical protein